MPPGTLRLSPSGSLHQRISLGNWSCSSPLLCRAPQRPANRPRYAFCLKINIWCLLALAGKAAQNIHVPSPDQQACQEVYSKPQEDAQQGGGRRREELGLSPRHQRNITGLHCFHPFEPSWGRTTWTLLNITKKAWEASHSGWWLNMVRNGRGKVTSHIYCQATHAVNSSCPVPNL